MRKPNGALTGKSVALMWVNIMLSNQISIGVHFMKMQLTTKYHKMINSLLQNFIIMLTLGHWRVAINTIRKLDVQVGLRHILNRLQYMWIICLLQGWVYDPMCVHIANLIGSHIWGPISGLIFNLLTLLGRVIYFQTKQNVSLVCSHRKFSVR